MIEKIGGIRNPLTIIAIFAGLAEVAGTVALATVSKELQGTFVWFVMGFPILLVLLFFLTLNFNPKVLYAPSDFRSDDGFLDMQRGGRIMASGFRGIETQLEALQEIVNKAIKQVGKPGEIERARLANVVDEQFELVRKEVEYTGRTASALVQMRGTIGTIPVSGGLTMDGLAAALTIHEQLGFAQLTGLQVDSGKARNLATFIAQPTQLGSLSICASGAASQGTKIISTTININGAQTKVDVYRLPLE